MHKVSNFNYSGFVQSRNTPCILKPRLDIDNVRECSINAIFPCGSKSSPALALYPFITKIVRNTDNYFVKPLGCGVLIGVTNQFLGRPRVCDLDLKKYTDDFEYFLLLNITDLNRYIIKNNFTIVSYQGLSVDTEADAGLSEDQKSLVFTMHNDIAVLNYGQFELTWDPSKKEDGDDNESDHLQIEALAGTQANEPSSVVLRNS